MGLHNPKHVLYAHPPVRTVSTKPYQYCTGTVYVRATLIFSRKERQTKREEQEEEMKNISKIS